MERINEQPVEEVIHLGAVAVETKGIVGLAHDADQSPRGGGGIVDD